MAETIGQQLKRVREANNLTIQEVVQATRIRANHIEAFEADDFEALPSPIQARGFLRLYAEFLGVSLDAAIARQRSDVESQYAILIEHPIDSSENPDTRKDLENTPRKLGPKSFSNILMGLFDRIVFFLRPPQDNSKIIDLVDNNETDAPIGNGNVEFVNSDADLVQLHEIIPSQAIFSTIGKSLRERREILSLTLEEVERHTHVRKHYLHALEAGEFAELPSSVQGRGMLNNYAHFLNLDVDSILLTFAEGLQTLRAERQLATETIPQKPAPKMPFFSAIQSRIRIPVIFRRYISVDILVGGGLIFLLLTFAIWGTNRVINFGAGSTLQPTAPSILNILVSSPEMETVSPGLTASVSEPDASFPVAGETLVVTLPAAGHGPVQVVVIAEESTWVRVTVDGKVQFEGRVTAGTAYPFDGNTQIEVLTGNGRAISILYNQNTLGPMGNFGEVVDRIYTTNAILNPTATFTPTPTISPTPTITLRPTATLRPSATPRPNAIPHTPTP
jgi:cytoskeleton protein RodZ